jgi:alpha-glucosidase (family GH31 glycosyl hydrolase)
LPYLYAAVKETCETGLPIIRALWLHYPDELTAVARGNEYLFGREILVAPVVEQSAATRSLYWSLYLPRGTWYDFWTRERVEGGREITRKVDLETTPLYVRAGAVIPMGSVKQYVSESVTTPLALWIHPGADGTFSLYEDDGKSFDYRTGEFMRINMAWNDRERRLSVRLATGSKMLGSSTRNFVAHVAGESTSRAFVFMAAESRSRCEFPTTIRAKLTEVIHPPPPARLPDRGIRPGMSASVPRFRCANLCCRNGVSQS